MSGLFPLDINYASVGTWLQDRHKLPADWLKKLQAVQSKAAEASRDLPPGFLSEFDGGEDGALDYFRVRQIRDKLAETSERGLFGRLAGSASVWDKLVKAYEKSLLYFGEAGLSMGKAVDFDIPYLKRQLESLNKQITDNERKQADCLRSATTSASSFEKECTKWGISGANLRNEIAKYGDGVFGAFQEAVDSLGRQETLEAMEYYRKFTEHAHGSDSCASFLPILVQVREGRVDPPVRHVADDVQAGAQNDASGGKNEDTGINWDIDAVDVGKEGLGETAGGIDWDIDLTQGVGEDLGEGGSNEVAADVGDEEGIAWNVDVQVEAGEAGNLAIDWDIPEDVKESSSAKGGGGRVDEPSGTGLDLSEEEIAASTAVLRIIYDSEFRGALLDDLYELQSFLQLRKLDLGQSESSFIAGGILPDDLRCVEASDIGTMLDNVNDAVNGFTSDQPRHLLMIKTSARFFERLVMDLEKQAGQEAKWRRMAGQVERRRKDLQRSLTENSLKLNALAKRTRMIKNAVEDGVSKQFSGREINVIGEVNSVLGGL